MTLNMSSQTVSSAISSALYPCRLDLFFGEPEVSNNTGGQIHNALLHARYQ